LFSSGATVLSAVLTRSQHHKDAPQAAAILDPATLSSFIDPLPIPPIAQSLGTRPNPGRTGANLPYYRIPIQQIESKVHRDLPPTRFWAYGRSMPGPTIEVRSGEGILVEWPNGLPKEHLLPIDHTLMGAERGVPNSRTVVHVHGAKAPPESDGYPENWYAPGGSALVHYPNQQPAALLWYHDHAMGITRLNIYAGMTGLFIIRDAYEDTLGLPHGAYEVPLVLSDRLFTQDGQLFYPRSESPDAPWVPEFFGNVTLVNGTIQPYLNVEPRLYRVRLLNASNSRFYYLSVEGATRIHQIGSDQGLLAAPVSLQNVAIGPGERADLLFDFALDAGKNIVLANGGSRLMQFRVAAQRSGVPVALLPQVLRPVERTPEASAINTRLLTIEELQEPMIHLLNGARWHDPVTETPILDSTEIWCFINMADEAHPIHLHLVRFQILDRFAFDLWDYRHTKQLRFVGHPVPPSPAEMGWKDTVRCDAKLVTRILVRFEGYVGRYVWHCHILEHEDNEMMRPFDVRPKLPATGSPITPGL
jgi:spore coat protein A